VVPTWTEAAQVGRSYEPDFLAAYQAGVQAFHKPATVDSPRVLAWLIDMQGDFIFPAPLGRLAVPGAVDDSVRTINWLYRNTEHITAIAASLDTHTPLQIFYAPWWKNPWGEHPTPFTVITAADVRERRWTPQIDPSWSAHYVRQLESGGKKQLMIWPFHCMEGTAGRALIPALSEAIMYHSAARNAQPIYLAKGLIPFTEFYSVLEPEVKYPERPDGVLNTAFLDEVVSYDLIYIAGQARSHCVLETVTSVMNQFADRPEIIAKFRFLDDCSSCITGFEAVTEVALREFEARGLRIVQSTDPLG